MPDAKSTIARLAVALGVTEDRAAVVLREVDHARAHASPQVDGPGGVAHAQTLGLSMFEELEGSALETGRTLPVAELAVPLSPEEPALGLIATRYEKLGMLGRGGMGEVHRVRDRRFDRILAMKVMRSDRSPSGATIAAFLREASIEARLQHPGVPPIYDRGTLPDGRPWYTMKQVEGERLSDAIRSLHEARADPQQFALLLREVLRAFEAVCRTMAYAHEEGVIHRDIKPTNIMLGAFGEVLVLDWGLAIELSDNSPTPSRSLQVVGTPSFMSPEQARGAARSLSASTDVYALGATLYHILSGHPPYHGMSGPSVLEHVLSDTPPLAIPRSTEDEGRYPPFLVRLCEQAMDPDPDKRPAGAQAMAAAIRDWLNTAERLERGRKELVRAHELKDASQTARAHAVALWLEASDMLEQSAGVRAPGWQRWQESREAFGSAKHFGERHRQALEASLAHTLDLREAREGLARHYSEVALKARERGAIDVARGAWTRTLQHLAALSPACARQIQSQIEDDRNAPLQVEHARRGSQIGREALRDELLERHAAAERFISLHGEPGVGKSSVLIEHGLQLQGGIHRPIYANFQNISDANSIEQHVGLAVGGDPLTITQPSSIAELLGEQSILLLLDNIDQCREFVCSAVLSWLQQCPRLQVVCTSRVPLTAEESTALRVPPLGRLGAIELLIRHALRADPDLDPYTLDREDLVAVVERLDGIPLAIELAAARLSSFRLDELRERLDRRLDMLRSGGGRAGGLDAAMAISWNSLSPGARTALAQASLFRSGMDRTAAEQVLQLTGDESAVLDALEELVRHNLMRASRSDDDRTRFLLSETVWSWASDRLEEESAESGLLDELVVRHATYFAQMRDTDSAATVSPLERAFELENFVLAAQRGPVDAAVSCAQLACTVLLTKGPVVRSIALVEQLLARDDLATAQRRELLILLGRCLRTAGRMQDARQRLREAQILSGERTMDAVPTAQEASEELSLSVSQDLADGVLAVDAHRYQDAQVHYERALTGSTRLGDVASQARAHAGLSMLPPAPGQPDQTRSHLEAAVALARSISDEPLALKTIGNYGLAVFRRGRLEEALACFAEAEAGHRLVDNHHAVAAFSMNQGILLQRMGQKEASAAAFDRSLDACDTAGDVRIRASVLGSKASLAVRNGQYTQAYRLADEALAWQTANGDLPMARRTRRLMAGICIDIGQLVKAQDHLDGLLPSSDEALEPSERLYEAVNRAALMLCSSGQEQSARAILERAADEAEQQGLESLRALALVNLSDAHALCGRAQEARRVVEEAVAMSQNRPGFEDTSGVAKGALAVMLARHGQYTEARALIHEAGTILKDWALEHLRLRIRSGLVAVHCGDHVEALLCLHEVRRATQRLGLGPQSPIRRLMSVLERTLWAQPATLIARLDRSTQSDVSPQQALCGLSELAVLAHMDLQLADARQLLDRAEQIAGELGDSRALARISMQRLQLAHGQGRTEEAVHRGAEALTHLASIQDPELELEIRAPLGILTLENGDFAASRSHLDAAERIAKELGDDRGLAIATRSQGLLSLAMQQYTTAEERFKLAEQAFDGIGLDRDAMLSSGNRGEALLRLHRLEEAKDVLELAVLRAGQYHHETAQAAFMGSLAELRARQGQFDDAWRLIERGMGLSLNLPFEKASFLTKAAIVATFAGRDEAAEDHLAQSRQLMEQMGDGLAHGLQHLLGIAHTIRRDPHRYLQTPHWS